jgi:hypothetical protein
MTRTSIGEYTEAVRLRYLGASKGEKGKILDEFTNLTGYYRKAMVRLLHWVNKPKVGTKRGHPRRYSAAAPRYTVATSYTWCSSNTVSVSTPRVNNEIGKVDIAFSSCLTL